MATISGIRTPTQGRTIHVIWETLTENDEVGDAISMPNTSNISVHVLGIVAGATVLIEGSNVLSPSVDNDWFTLHDENGDFLSFTIVDIGHTISENVLNIRPRLIGGSDTDIDVIMLFTF